MQPEQAFSSGNANILVQNNFLLVGLWGPRYQGTGRGGGRFTGMDFGHFYNKRGMAPPPLELPADCAAAISVSKPYAQTQNMKCNFSLIKIMAASRTFSPPLLGGGARMSDQDVGC